MNNQPKSAYAEIFEILSPEADYLFINSSQITGAGKGLFTAIKIFKHEIIAIFSGKILSQTEIKIRSAKKLDAYFINMINGTIMDCRSSKCFAKYANDAEGPIKTKYKNNSIITLNFETRVCIVATKTINPGAEIFCGYGSQYWANFKKQNNM